LDQLPLLASVEGQAAVLASLNPPEEDANQATLSLEVALTELETPAPDANLLAPDQANESSVEEPLPDEPPAQASESTPHD
jgi:hypothetical protein